jgi:hypothetical protein
MKNYKFNEPKWWIDELDRSGELSVDCVLGLKATTKIEFFDTKEEWEEELKKRGIDKPYDELNQL